MKSDEEIEEEAKREVLAEMEEINNEVDTPEIPLTDKEFRDLTIQSIRSLWMAFYFLVILIVAAFIILNWRLNVNMERFSLDAYNVSKAYGKELIMGVKL